MVVLELDDVATYGEPFCSKLPVKLMSPTTCSLRIGFAVPMPTLPVVALTVTWDGFAMTTLLGAGNTGLEVSMRVDCGPPDALRATNIDNIGDQHSDDHFAIAPFVVVSLPSQLMPSGDMAICGLLAVEPRALNMKTDNSGDQMTLVALPSARVEEMSRSCQAFPSYDVMVESAPTAKNMPSSGDQHTDITLLLGIVTLSHVSPSTDVIT